MSFKKDESIDQKLGTRFTSQSKKINVSAIELLRPVKEFTIVVPENCLINPKEKIPGAQNLPDCIIHNENCLDQAKFDKLTKIYAHNISIKNINKVDHIVSKFFKNVKSGYRGEITARKLVFETSNSCSILSDPYSSTTRDFTVKKSGKDQIQQVTLDNKVLQVSNVPAVN